MAGALQLTGRDAPPAEAAHGGADGRSVGGESAWKAGGAGEAAGAQPLGSSVAELPPADAALLRERPVTLALLTTTLVFSYLDRQLLASLFEPIKKGASASSRLSRLS
jgi:hypothetical protein